MKRLVVVIALVVTSAVYGQQQFGTFIGEVVAKWDTNGRTMTLMEPFAYIDPDGRRWNAPKGAQIDGASIPRIAWSIIGGPFEGQYRAASVIHDVACVERQQDWRKVHRAFFTGMRAGGVAQTQAKIMFAAVYHFGPRWAVREVKTVCNPGSSCHPETVMIQSLSYSLVEAQFEELAGIIRKRDQQTPGSVQIAPLSVEDIEAYVPLR